MGFLFELTNMAMTNNWTPNVPKKDCDKDLPELNITGTTDISTTKNICKGGHRIYPPEKI